MKPLALAAFVVFGCSPALPAAAGPGDVYVPAHRTADGLVGAGQRAAVLGRNAHGAQAPGSLREAAGCDATSTASPAVPPLFVAAEPIRR